MKWVVGSTNPVKIDCVRGAVLKCMPPIKSQPATSTNCDTDMDSDVTSGNSISDHIFIGVAVPDTYTIPSHTPSMPIPPQPMDGYTTRLGAYRRAMGALASFDKLKQDKYSQQGDLADKGQISTDHTNKNDIEDDDSVVFGVGIEGGLEYWADWDSMAYSSDVCARTLNKNEMDNDLLENREKNEDSSPSVEAVLSQRHRWFESGWICIIERRRSNNAKFSAQMCADDCKYTYRQGWGSSARIEMSPAIVRRMMLTLEVKSKISNIESSNKVQPKSESRYAETMFLHKDSLQHDLRAGVELGPVMDALFARDVEQNSKQSGADGDPETVKNRNCGQGIGAFGILTNGGLTRMEAYQHGVIFALSPWLSNRHLYWGEKEEDNETRKET